MKTRTKKTLLPVLVAGIESGLRPATSSTFSAAVRVGMRLKNWKTNPTEWRRKAVLWSRPRSVSFVSATTTSPEEASSQCASGCGRAGM